jgi:hypothetical protein
MFRPNRDASEAGCTEDLRMSEVNEAVSDQREDASEWLGVLVGEFETEDEHSARTQRAGWWGWVEYHSSGLRFG